MSQATDSAVHFRLVGGSNPVILVPAFVNDAGPYDFIFDSGAMRSMVSVGLALSLEIQCGSQEQAFGAGGEIQVSLAQVRSIAVGSVRQEPSQVCISDDLEGIGKALKMKLDGLIGFDFMREFRVTIDYVHNVLDLARPSGSCCENTPSDKGIPFTLTPGEPLILLKTFVNDQGPFQFILDTAAGKTVVTPELIDRLAIPTNQGIAGAGMGGKLETRRSTLESLTVGITTVQDHAVIVGAFLDSISTAVGVKLDGIIGNNFLRQFRVTIDCPAHTLVLEDDTEASAHLPTP